MNIGIVYCSQTGHTQKYAHWLAESLGCEATPYAKRDDLDLKALDTLIFCSWTHAASIKDTKWVKKVIETYPRLEVIIVFTGASPMPKTEEERDEIEKAFRQTFPETLYPDLPHFYCRGGFDFKKLSTFDKMAMRIYFKMSEKEDNSPRTEEMLSSMREGFDATNRGNLTPVIMFLNERHH